MREGGRTVKKRGAGAGGGLDGQGALDEGVEGSEVAAAGVLGLRAGDPVLDGRVPADALLGAKVLLDSAVDVADDDGRVALVGGRELVPSGLHPLAMASPRGLELNDGVLALEGAVKGGAVELAGRDGEEHGAEREEAGDDLHCDAVK